jgi:hypothetical protein
MSNTDRGVLGGGALGAVTGTIIGAATGHPGAGAAIGAGAGAVAGGLTGAAVDHSERKQAAAAAARRCPPLSLQEVVQLTQSGTSDAIIIDQIRGSGQVYHLTAQDIIWLQNQGVREPVIHEMQATAWQSPRQVYTSAPVVYEVVPAAPPPVAVGVGFSTRIR